MNTENGGVKFYREWLDNPIITKDSEHLAVWTYLFVKAIHTEKDSIFRGKQITLKAGQLLALQKDICEILKIEPTKLRRILKMLKSAELIDYQTDKHKNQRQSQITFRRRDRRAEQRTKRAVDHHAAKAVQRQPRTEEEAAIFKNPPRAERVEHLIDPAGDGKENKHQQQISNPFHLAPPFSKNPCGGIRRDSLG